MENYIYPIINQQAFYDGQSIDEKIGAKASVAYVKGFDWRKNPSELVQTVQPRKLNAGNLGELIINIEQVATGERFALGKDGSLFLIDTSNAVKRIGDIGEPGGFGLKYRVDTDTLYIAGRENIHTYSPVKDQSTRKLTRNFLKERVSTNTSGSYPSIRNNQPGEQYSLKSSLIEDHKLLFTADIEPLHSVRLRVAEVGTGDWTVVIHDPLKRVVASKTIANADMNTNEFSFVFSNPAELLVKPNARIYHMHVYSSDGTGSIYSLASGDLNTADFKIVADRMVTTRRDIHPIEHFLQYLAIQHGRYIALWEPLSAEPDNTEYEAHKLTVPDNYEGCGMAKTDEYLIGAFEKVAEDGSKQFQEGLLVFWDGLSKIGNSGSYNFYIELTEGAPQAIYTKNNIPHIVIQGTLYVWLGGKTLTRVRDLPNIDNEFTGIKDDTVMYPYMLTSFKKLLQIGYPSTSSLTDLEFGIYNFGSVAPEYNPSFGLQYLLSHGSLNTSEDAELEIGCVRGFGDEMYISWRKGDEYGLDIIDSDCAPSADFKVRLRRFDAQNVHKQKGFHRVLITTNPVPEGTSVYPTYRIDDEVEVVATEAMPEGATQAVVVIDSRFHVVDYGLEGTSESSATSPLRVRGIALEWEPLQDEDIADAE